MSQQKTYQIRCPNCRKDQGVQLYESINVQNTPELKKQLILNQTNTVTCEQCSLTFWVNKPLLYHDPGRHFMIYQFPLGENTVSAREDCF